MRVKTVVLTTIGLSLLVFSVVWMTVVFPSQKKIPEDYNQVIDFQGNYAIVANQEFYQELLANPAVQDILGSPKTLELLSQPATWQVLTSDALGPVLANPGLLLQALSDPDAFVQAGNAALVEILTNPAVQTLLADPAIMGLLADPEALRLMLDDRTAQLMAAPQQLDMVEIPIDFHRIRTARRTEGDILYLHQDFSASIAGVGQPLPQFSSTSTLAVHRETREYVEGGSEPRRGRFAFPFDVEKEREYSIWVHEVFQPLTARYVSTEQVEGLEVYVFRMHERGLVLPDQAKLDIGLPVSLPLTADVDMTTKTDPKSGITVFLESEINYDLQVPALGNPTIFKARINDTPESVHASVSDARDVKRQLFWLGTFLPWSTLGLGLVLGAGAVALRFRLSSASGRQD